jgi:hypothetical protein
MCGAAAVKDTRVRVDPGAKLSGLTSSGKRINLAILFWDELLDLTIVLFVQLERASRDKSSGGSDTSDLGTQQVLLFAEEEGVSHDVPLEVT